jgi:hypothetical protein
VFFCLICGFAPNRCKESIVATSACSCRSGLGAQVGLVLFVGNLQLP